jgi:UTP--glucose-1-phosphate uridylyltransferase
MARQFEAERCSILGVEDIPRSQTGSYGIVSPERAGAELCAIKAIVEKPAPAQAPSTLAVVGRYVLTPAIFGQLAAVKPGRGGEIQLTDAISALLAVEKVMAFRFAGRRFDCGSKLGYLQAMVELGAKHPEVGPGFAQYLKERGRA